jgi:NADH-quinone oxidoreductase subunit A
MNFEKLSSFECGLEPLPIRQKPHNSYKARFKFDLLFYLIALLYLIFDLELVLLFPVALMSSYLAPIHLYVVVAFFVLLILGFYYEYLEGGLSL